MTARTRIRFSMLISGIVLLVLASIIGGWVFACDAFPIPPKLAREPLTLLMATPIGIVAIVLLFIVKWYMGLLGIIGAVVGFNVFAGIWYAIYKRFRL